MRRLRIELELLEDLHSGSGTGAGDIDALLARDRYGRPVLRASHVKGVWKDALPDSTLKAALFGASRETAGQLSLTSFYAVPPESGEPPGELLWSSTAFESGNRAPREDTLRTRQFIAAGTRFAATAWLPEGLEPALVQAVTAADALGARRRRGDGLVTVTGWDIKSGEPGRIDGNPAGPAPRLRLLLSAEEPVCLPLTGFPGNILPGECYVRGQQLLGGIAKTLLDAGQIEAAADWLGRRIRVGDAYPLPGPAERDHPPVPEGWQDWTVRPIPLAYQRGKPSGGGRAFPWWAETGDGTTRDASILDKFAERSDDETPGTSAGGGPETAGPATPRQKAGDGEKPKRPGDREFLFRARPEGGEPWRLFVSPMSLRMRNALPRPKPPGKTRQDPPEYDAGGLFTQEEISEHTRFLAEIRFPGADTARRAAAALLPWIGGGRCLNLGRGGAPVVIEAAAWLPESPTEGGYGGNEPGSGATSDSVTLSPAAPLELLLTADLIARDASLAFRENLDAAALAELCGLSPAEFAPDRVKTRSVADTVEIHGFNALTGLPRMPALAIRRGSCWRFTGQGEAGAEALGRLRAALAARLDSGLGERRWEGFGAFVLDFYQDMPPERVQRQGAAAGTESGAHGDAIAPSERAIEAAAGLWEEYWVKKHNRNPDKIPRLVHWQRLRAVAQQGPEALRERLEGMAQAQQDGHAGTEQEHVRDWAVWLLEAFADREHIAADALYRQLLRQARLDLRFTGEAS